MRTYMSVTAKEGLEQYPVEAASGQASFRNAS
jgi:hypothetical protein